MRLKTLFFIFLLFANSTYAATLEVGAGKTYSTIQAGVNVAVAGDTVLVYPGTYNEGVFISNGKSGTETSPIIIKAQYPARRPLNGGDWADTAEKRSVINASGQTAGIYNDQYSGGAVSNIIIDGFYITGGTDSSIYFVNDHDFWIKNNIAINSGLNLDEDFGCFTLNWVTNSLIQNNYAEFSASVTSSTSLYEVDGANNILEYNECVINSNVSTSGRCLYIRHNSTNFIFRYNYLYLISQVSTQYARFRDFTNLTFTHNYIRSTASQYFMVVHENTDNGLIEAHQINNNTFAYENGIGSTQDGLGIGYMNDTEIKNNIFYSGINDTGSYGIGPGWTVPSYSVTIDYNVWYNWIDLIDPAVTNYTETNSQNTNPNINLSTGCASSVDDDVYGANLDISQIPYRKCDGTFYPIANKFGILQGSISGISFSGGSMR